MSSKWRNPEYRRGCYRPMPVEVDDFNADARCPGCGNHVGRFGSLCPTCRVESFYDFRGDYLGSRNR